MESSDESYTFVYRIGGELIPISDPFAEIDRPESMNKAGYFHLADFGNPDCFGIKVWRHDDRLSWWITMDDFHTSCHIHCDGWPCLLDAMTRYAPLAQMSALPDLP